MKVFDRAPLPAEEEGEVRLGLDTGDDHRRQRTAQQAEHLGIVRADPDHPIADLDREPCVAPGREAHVDPRVGRLPEHPALVGLVGVRLVARLDCTRTLAADRHDHGVVDQPPRHVDDVPQHRLEREPQPLGEVGTDLAE